MSPLSPNYAKTADGATDAGGDQETGGSLPREEGFSSLEHLTISLESLREWSLFCKKFSCCYAFLLLIYGKEGGRGELRYKTADRLKFPIVCHRTLQLNTGGGILVQ